MDNWYYFNWLSGDHICEQHIHNLDVIKTADRVIDMGPEGGDEGGIVAAEGTPEQVAGTAGSHTGGFLAELVVPSKPGSKAKTAGKASAKKKAAPRRTKAADRPAKAAA